MTFARFPKLAPEIDQAILITPNERLSNQHIAEFVQSGIPAQTFSQSRGQYGMFRGLEEPVQVIEVSKLADLGTIPDEGTLYLRNRNLPRVDPCENGVYVVRINRVFAQFASQWVDGHFHT